MASPLLDLVDFLSSCPLFYVEEILEISTEESTQVQRLFLEDLQVGDNWLSDEREITAEDVADFALLTGDHDPLHEDNGMASPFGEPVAHGLLGLSVLAGLSSSRPAVATLALVGISDFISGASALPMDAVSLNCRASNLVMILPMRSNWFSPMGFDGAPTSG